MKNNIISLVAFLFLLACSSESKKQEQVVTNQNSTAVKTSACPEYILRNKYNNLNISILIDLSNRIDIDNQQANDSAYIVSLAKAFNTHVKQKKLGLLYDKMELFFEPPPKDKKINELSEQLKIAYTKGVSKNEWLPKTIERYSDIPDQIYELARNASITNGYQGSDTWRFFGDHIKDYCIDSCSRNILVILTDGYMYHEESVAKSNNRTSYLTPQSLNALPLKNHDWLNKIEQLNLGFIPAEKDLNDLEILVIGIQSQNKKHPYALDIIEAYWSKWFQEMGVQKFKIKKADLPSRIEKVIIDFLN